MSGACRPLLLLGAFVVVAAAAVIVIVLVAEDDDLVLIAPLTGMPVDEELDHPIVAVRVDNHPRARPQTGLGQADIVFEVLTEGGITRFVALYHSQLPDTVGPVRSGRLVDLDLLPAYDPLFAISGARADVLAVLADRVEVITETGPPIFSRSDDRQAPHNLYLHPPALLGAAADRADVPEAPVWEFAGEQPDGGAEVDEVTVTLSPASQTGWRYEADRGTYVRLQDGAEGPGPAERVEASNVLVVGATVVPLADGLVRIDVIGSGPAILLRDGLWYDAGWHKDAAHEHVEIRTAEGEPLPLRPGPTWIVIPPVEQMPER
jgi:hypothetical protein